VEVNLENGELYVVNAAAVDRTASQMTNQKKEI
jgi:hypothetical protein